MEILVDQDLCISCGLCIDCCPMVFDWNKKGKASVQVDDVPVNAKNCSKEAIKECPVDAIKKI